MTQGMMIFFEVFPRHLFSCKQPRSTIRDQDCANPSSDSREDSDFVEQTPHVEDNETVAESDAEETTEPLPYITPQ